MMEHMKRHTMGAVIAATLAAVALGACTREEGQQARTEGRETAAKAGAAVDDAALTTKVKAALLADDQVKGTQINVDSNGGTVKLTGTVDTPAQITRAVEIARGVQGVRTVENNLTASGSAAAGVVPGTQPPGTSPSATPNQTTPPASSPRK
jgi:hyperosmotically inducible periplasmic protein